MKIEVGKTYRFKSDNGITPSNFEHNHIKYVQFMTIINNMQLDYITRVLEEDKKYRKCQEHLSHINFHFSYFYDIVFQAKVKDIQSSSIHSSDGIYLILERDSIKFDKFVSRPPKKIQIK